MALNLPKLAESGDRVLPLFTFGFGDTVLITEETDFSYCLRYWYRVEPVDSYKPGAILIDSAIQIVAYRLCHLYGNLVTVLRNQKVVHRLSLGTHYSNPDVTGLWYLHPNAVPDIQHLKGLRVPGTS